MVLHHDDSNLDDYFSNNHLFFLCLVPIAHNLALIGIIGHPELSHIHHAWVMSFYSAVGDAICSWIIGVNKCGWVWMAHIRKGWAHYFSFLYINRAPICSSDEEATMFQMISYIVWTATLRNIGWSGFIYFPMNMC